MSRTPNSCNNMSGDIGSFWLGVCGCNLAIPRSVRLSTNCLENSQGISRNKCNVRTADRYARIDWMAFRERDKNCANKHRLSSEAGKGCKPKCDAKRKYALHCVLRLLRVPAAYALRLDSWTSRLNSRRPSTTEKGVSAVGKFTNYA